MHKPAHLARSFHTLAALASALALTFAAAAQAQVYKYTDANGQVHYADRAPSNAEQVKGPSAPATPAAPAAAAAAPNATGNAPPASPPSLAITSEQTRAVQRDVAAAREEQCKKARENYDKAVRAQRVYRTNDKGEREFVSAAEADALRLQVKADMDASCGR